MPTYYVKVTSTGESVIIKVEGDVLTSFTENPENADWRAYQEWLAEGNTPKPWLPAE